MNDLSDVLRGLSVQIAEIRYTLIGMASEEEKRGGVARRTAETKSEALSVAASLLEEAAKSIRTVAGE